VTLWVICDRFSRFCLPVHVRFAPKATEVLHCRKMTRCAISGRKPFLHCCIAAGSEEMPGFQSGMNLSATPFMQ
jgi:hypothetical protein